MSVVRPAEGLAAIALTFAGSLVLASCSEAEPAPAPPGRGVSMAPSTPPPSPSAPSPAAARTPAARTPRFDSPSAPRAPASAAPATDEPSTARAPAPPEGPGDQAEAADPQATDPQATDEAALRTLLASSETCLTAVSPRGSISLSVRVMRSTSGVITRAEIDGDPIPSEALTCLRTRLEGQRLPPPTDSPAVSTRLDYRWQAPDEDSATR